MGTSGPPAVAAIRDSLAAGGVTMVDAPVSGSTAAAEAGTLLIMVGAYDEDYDRARSVLEAMGDPVHVGPPGAGAVLKLATNSVIFAINQAVGESVVLAETAGVAPAVTVDVIARGAAGAPIVTYRTPNYIDPVGAPVTFTLDLALKDLTLVGDAARAAGVDMPQADRTYDVTADGIVASGEGDHDLGFVVEAVRRGSQPRSLDQLRGGQRMTAVDDLVSAGQTRLWIGGQWVKRTTAARRRLRPGDRAARAADGGAVDDGSPP